MKVTTKKYDERLKVDLTTFVEKIEPLSQYNGGEYGPGVVDYTLTKAEYTNRYIPAYTVSKTHGEKVVTAYSQLLDNVPFNNVLELGCGDGEILNYIKKQKEDVDVYGCTIHLGEVRAAKENYGIDSVGS